MKFILLLFCFYFNLTLIASSSFGQSPDSLSCTSTYPAFSLKNLSSLRCTDFLRIGIPALMIGYGFSALENEDFESLDGRIKDEVTEDHPNFNFPLDGYLKDAPAAAVYILNIAGIHGSNKFIDRTNILGMSLLLEETMVNRIKHWSPVPRPDGGDNLSFPSGHTATAFATAEFLRKEYQDVSPWIGAGGYAAASITGVLRIYNNRHWFSDVVAGAGIGILSTDIVYAVYPFIKRKLFPNSKFIAVLVPYYHYPDKGVTIIFSFQNPESPQNHR